MEIIKVCKKHGDLTEGECVIHIEKRYGEPKSQFVCNYCKKESMRKYYAKPEKAKKHIQDTKNWRIKNHERNEKNRIIYKFNNRERLNAVERNRRQSNPEKARMTIRNQKRKEIKELKDSYIKAVLTHNRNGRNSLKMGDLPRELIEIKRVSLLLKRIIKHKLKNE